MKIKDVERYTIPLGTSTSLQSETTVEELIKGLKKLPPKGIVSVDYGGSSNLFVTHTKKDIDSECPWDAEIQRALRQMATASYIPPQYMR
ncbi:hypothetical protein ODIN_45 [Mycobacterium phage Odin]|nr:hypothetical protein ODIN_45 [Mycobacterium phage Odin]